MVNEIKKSIHSLGEKVCNIGRDSTEDEHFRKEDEKWYKKRGWKKIFANEIYILSN